MCFRPAAELPEDAVDRDQLLTNVSLYWFTRDRRSSDVWDQGDPAGTGFGWACNVPARLSV